MHFLKIYATAASRPIEWRKKTIKISHSISMLTAARYAIAMISIVTMHSNSKWVNDPSITWNPLVFFLLWNGNMNRIICNPFYATITYTESHWNQIQLATPYKNSALCWRFCISTFRLRIDKMFDFIWINAHLWKLIDLSICHCTGLKLKTSLIISMCCAYSS